MVEEPREPQSPPLPPTPPLDYAPPGPPAPPYAAPPPGQPSSAELAARIVRLLMRRALWVGEQAWSALLPRLGWIALTAFLLSVIAVLSLLLALPRLARTEASSDPRVAALPPAAAVEDFLRGQQTFDADLMWGAFSPDLRQSLEEREITRDTFAQKVERERQAGNRYRINYIGGVELASHERMYFYLLETTAPQPETTSFIFTVGSDGKIVNMQ